LGYIHCILFAIIAVILAVGPAWAQSDSSQSRAKAVKIDKKTGVVVKNEFDREPTPQQLKEIRKHLGLKDDQDPEANDVIFYHSPNPGTCVWVGFWRCY